MQVVLKVVGGKNDGREITIAVPRFIIGRGETAHLRPASDLVSREHCAIEVGNGKVTITDLNSRNGSFVNGNQLSEPHVARAGDSVRIGRLQFQLLIDPVKASVKKPKVNSVLDAASRTAKAKKSSLEDSITDWLLEAGDEESPDTGERQVIASSETIQLNFEETKSIRKDADETEHADDLNDSAVLDADAEADETGNAGKKKKKDKPKKLPPLPKFKHESSTTAADDVLKKFFNRR